MLIGIANSRLFDWMTWHVSNGHVALVFFINWSICNKQQIQRGKTSILTVSERASPSTFTLASIVGSCQAKTFRALKEICSMR